MTTGSTTIITKSLLSGLLTNTDRGLVLPPSDSFSCIPGLRHRGHLGVGTRGYPIGWLRDLGQVTSPFCTQFPYKKKDELGPCASKDAAISWDRT